MERLTIKAYTDGSCLGNPGVCGYAGVMYAKGKKRVCAGYSAKTNETNNRAELMAVICVVDWCNNVQKTPCEIEVYTDSQVLVSCCKKSRKELTSSSRKNNDLWLELIEKGLKGHHHITFKKVKGHSDDEYNHEADQLAKAQAIKARHEAFGG